MSEHFPSKKSYGKNLPRNSKVSSTNVKITNIRKNKVSCKYTKDW